MSKNIFDIDVGNQCLKSPSRCEISITWWAFHSPWRHVQFTEKSDAHFTSNVISFLEIDVMNSIAQIFWPAIEHPRHHELRQIARDIMITSRSSQLRFSTTHLQNSNEFSISHRTSPNSLGRFDLSTFKFFRTLVLFFSFRVGFEQWFSFSCILFSLEQSRVVDFNGYWASSWFNFRIPCSEFRILSAFVATYEWFPRQFCQIQCVSTNICTWSRCDIS